MNESEITEKLVNIIENDQFYSSIKGIPEAKALYESSTSINSTPSFTIDYILRNKSIRNNWEIISSLHDLEIISVDRDISTEKNEVLRPDILLYNSEEDKIIIVEIKKSTKTERETITELLAYEHEIKNTIPFISNKDIQFVIISTEWNTLLKHSLSSIIFWSNKKISGLHLDIIDFSMSPVIADSWSRVRYLDFDEDLFCGFNISLINYSDDKEIEERVKDTITRTALNIVAKDNIISESNGFAFCSVLNNEVSHSERIITVIVLNPFNILKANIINGDIDKESPVLSYFSNKIEGYESSVTNGILETVSNAKKYLEQYWDCVSIENLYSWNTLKKNILSDCAIPYSVQSWGILDNYLKELFLHDYTQQTLFSNIKENGLDWTYPQVFFPLLLNILNKGVFKRGNINIDDLFKFGVNIGRLFCCVSNTLCNEEHPKIYNLFYSIFNWEMYDFSDSISNLNLVFHGSETEQFQFDLNSLEKIQKSLKLYMEYFSNNILSEEIFKHAFLFGINIGQVYLSENIPALQSYTNENLKLYCDMANDFLDYLGKEDLYPLKDNANFIGRYISYEDIYNRKKFHIKDFKNNPDETFSIIYHIFSKLSKNYSMIKKKSNLSDLLKMNIDWKDLKDGYYRLKRKGQDSGLYFAENGNIGLVDLDSIDEAARLDRNCLDDDGIFIIDDTSGYRYMFPTTWERIMKKDV